MEWRKLPYLPKHEMRVFCYFMEKWIIALQSCTKWIISCIGIFPENWRFFEMCLLIYRIFLYSAKYCMWQENSQFHFIVYYTGGDHKGGSVDWVRNVPGGNKLSVCDFRLLPWCKCDLRSSGMLHPFFSGEAVQEELLGLWRWNW